MKMINSTSMTSHSGMMLMSAIGAPSPPPDENAIVRYSRSVLFAGRDKAHLAHTLLLRKGDHLVDDPVRRRGIATHVDRWLRRFLRFHRQGAVEQVHRHRLVV